METKTEVMQQEKKSIRIQLPEKIARKGFIVAAKAGMTRKEFIEMKITELFTGKGDSLRK